MTTRSGPTRRALLKMAVGGALSGSLLAACGSPMPSASKSDSAPTPAAKPAAPTEAAKSAAPVAATAAPAANTAAPAATKPAAPATAAGAATTPAAGAATTPAAAVATKPAAAPAAAAPATLQPATVEWWVAPGTDVGSKDAQESLLPLFAKTPAGEKVKVNAQIIPEGGYDDKLTTAFATGSGLPDVAIIGNAEWFPKVNDLRDYIARDKLDVGMYSKSHFDIHSRYLDQIVALPLGVGATMYFYNQTLLDAKGVKAPEWGYKADQFLADALKIGDKSKKIYGSFRQQTIWRGEFFAFGARPFSEDGTKVEGFMNGPKTVRAFEFMHDWLTSDAVPTSAENDVLRTEGTGPLDLFNTGRLGFGALNNGQFKVVDKAGVKFGLVHQPVVDGEDYWHNGWTTRIGMPQASKVKDGAWEWIKFFTGEPGQRHLMSLDQGFTPAIPELWKQHPGAADPRLQFFFKITGQTRQLREFLFKFPYVAKVTRLNQELYDQIYLKRIAKADIKKRLDETVPMAQKVIDEERAKLKL
jgi:ABC-type glycerol-3-phosphate transport system substrate-binding protein